MSGPVETTNCKKCGAKIFFAYSGGKYKPLDVKAVPCIDATEELPATETLFTMGGVPFQAVTGDDIPDYVDTFFYGYRSHFATCPAANEFRKSGKRVQTRGQTTMEGF